MRLKVSSAKRRPFCLGLDVLTMAIRRQAITRTLTIGHRCTKKKVLCKWGGIKSILMEEYHYKNNVCWILLMMISKYRHIFIVKNWYDF